MADERQDYAERWLGSVAASEEPLDQAMNYLCEGLGYAVVQYPEAVPRLEKITRMVNDAANAVGDLLVPLPEGES